MKMFKPAVLMLLAAIALPAFAQLEDTVITSPEPFEGPSNDEAPLLGASGGGNGGSQDDAAKTQRIIKQLCQSKGASGDLDRVGPYLWFGSDAVNKGDCK
jgi:hypothetical protein